MASVNESFEPPWKKWSDEFGNASRATSRDQIQFDMEEKALLALLGNKAERIFDIGCGNGATLKGLLSAGITPGAMGGCDMLADFVETAKKELPGAVLFQMDLMDNAHGGWDKIKDFRPTFVIVKRVLCNLSGRKTQRGAVCHICEQLPSGARITMIEPMMDGLMKLNHLRATFGLELITEPPFNEYLRWADISATLEHSGMKDIRRHDHTSTYHVGSRVLQPFLHPGVEPKYDHPINKFFSGLPVREGFGMHWVISAVKK